MSNRGVDKLEQVTLEKQAFQKEHEDNHVPTVYVSV